MQLSDAIAKLQKEGIDINANQAARFLTNQKIDPNGDLSEETIGLLRTLSLKKPEPKPADKADGKLATAKQQEQQKGALSAASQKFAQTAITSTVKEFAQVADMETRVGAAAYLSRKASNMKKLTETLIGFNGANSAQVSVIEEDIDIDALLAEVAGDPVLFEAGADPLLLSA